MKFVRISFVYKVDQRGIALNVSTTLAAIPLITATILEISRQSETTAFCNIQFFGLFCYHDSL
jgi:hypothetical protein